MIGPTPALVSMATPVQIEMFRTKRTQVEMVRDRGYIIPEEEAFILELPLQSTQDFHDAALRFVSVFPNRSDLSRVYEKESGERLYVHYAEEDPASKHLGNEEVKTFCRLREEYHARYAIIISKKKIAPAAAASIRTINRTDIQHFTDNELQFNITHHDYAIRHQKLTADERREFFAKNSRTIRPAQLANLRFYPVGIKDKEGLTIDPTVKYYGFVPGDVIRVYQVHFGAETAINRNIVHKLVI